MSKDNFQSELRGLLNRHSMENGSDTPDFILAEYLTGCLEIYNDILVKRSKWYGGKIPGKQSHTQAAEQKGNKDWEIESIIRDSNKSVYNYEKWDTGHGFFGWNYDYVMAAKIGKGYSIHSVRRLRDDFLVTVGMDTPKGKVTKLELPHPDGDNIYVHYDLGGWDYLHHVKAAKLQSIHTKERIEDHEDEFLKYLVSQKEKFVKEDKYQTAAEWRIVERLYRNHLKIKALNEPPAGNLISLNKVVEDFLASGINWHTTDEESYKGKYTQQQVDELCEAAFNAATETTSDSFGYGKKYRTYQDYKNPPTEKPKQEVLFVTEDGVEISEFGEYWWVKHDFSFGKEKARKGIMSPYMPRFSTEEKAQEYITQNKPLNLSMKEIASCITNYVMAGMPPKEGTTVIDWRKLDELIKQKTKSI